MSSLASRNRKFSRLSIIFVLYSCLLTICISASKPPSPLEIVIIIYAKYTHNAAFMRDSRCTARHIELYIFFQFFVVTIDAVYERKCEIKKGVIDPSTLTSCVPERDCEASSENSDALMQRRIPPEPPRH